MSLTNVDYRYVLVTNWVYPWQGLRTVNGKIYDVNYSQLWQWVDIPAGAEILGARYYGSVQPTDVTFVWGNDPRNEQTVVVLNYPYDPRNFRHPEGERGVIVTSGPMDLHVFPINIQTNWTPLGKMWIGTRTYDYGLAYTNLVPLEKWVKVPASQLPPPPAPPVTQPQPGTITTVMQPPGRDIFGDTLSNQFTQAASITSLPQRDNYYAMLTDRAVQAGNMDMAKQCLGNIINLQLRDGTASNIARLLEQQGDTRDALIMANMITSTRIRNLTLQAINQ